MSSPNMKHPAMSGSPSDTTPTRVVAVTSGKGGVGKTCISVNLAVTLARQGAKVCLLDADTGLANVNILLGLSPRYTLEHVSSGERQLEEILVPGPVGVDIIPGASGLMSLADPDPESLRALLDGLSRIEQQYDYLLIDTAAGISASVLHFVASAQTALVVITPEPTSLTDAFSLLKVLHQKGYKRTVQILVNQVADSRQAWRIFERFQAAVAKYIGLPVQWLAYIPRDDAVRRAVMAQNPVVLAAEGQPASLAFSSLAEILAQHFQENRVPNAVFSRYWQRLFERTARQATHNRPESPSRENSSSAAVQAGGSSDSAHDFEKRWLSLRRELIAMSGSGQPTPEHWLQMLSELLESLGEQLGPLRAELVYGLLRQMEPAHLQEDLRQLLAIECYRLGLRSGGASGEVAADEPAEAIAENIDPVPVERLQPVPAEGSVRKHGFDEARFGSQEELLRRIQASNGRQSLTSLLASLRQDALVRRG